MKIITSEKDSYVPKWNGNRDLVEAERMIVDYTNLAWDARRKHHTHDKTKIIVRDIGNAKDADIDNAVDEQCADAEVAVDIDNAAITAAMKPTIRNLFDEKNDEPIDTWDKLLKTPDACGLRKLIAEIERELPNSQRGKDSKNS